MADEFSHRKTHRGDWEIISSNLRWQLRVFNLTKPDWHGTDARRGNRLFCIRAGNGFLRQVENGKKLDLIPGYAYFIPKDVSVEQNFPADLELYAMEFQIDLLPGLDLFAPNRNLVEFKPSPQFFQMLADAYSGEPSWENFFQFESLRQQILIRLLHEMIEQVMKITCPDKAVDYSASQEEIVRNVHRYLTEHLSERITIEELSRKFLMNATTLKNVFKQVYGTTIAAHMRMHRLEQAALLLQTTKDDIASIAQAVGYDSASRFTTAFREMYGETPTGFRRSRQK